MHHGTRAAKQKTYQSVFSTIFGRNIQNRGFEIKTGEKPREQRKCLYPSRSAGMRRSGLTHLNYCNSLRTLLTEFSRMEPMNTVGRGSCRAMPYLVFARVYAGARLGLQVWAILGGDERKACEWHGSAGASPYRASGMRRFIGNLALPRALA